MTESLIFTNYSSGIFASDIESLRHYPTDYKDLTVDQALLRHDMSLLLALKRCWVSSHEDFHYQKSRCEPGVPYPDWFFDALYYGSININRFGAYAGVYTNNIFNLERLSDLQIITQWAVNHDQVWFLADLGTSLSNKSYGYIALITNGDFLNPYLIFKARRHDIEQWKSLDEEDADLFWGPITYRADISDSSINDILQIVDECFHYCATHSFGNKLVDWLLFDTRRTDVEKYFKALYALHLNTNPDTDEALHVKPASGYSSKQYLDDPETFH